MFGTKLLFYSYPYQPFLVLFQLIFLFSVLRLIIFTLFSFLSSPSIHPSLLRSFSFYSSFSSSIHPSLLLFILLSFCSSLSIHPSLLLFFSFYLSISASFLLLIFILLSFGASPCIPFSLHSTQSLSFPTPLLLLNLLFSCSLTYTKPSAAPLLLLILLISCSPTPTNPSIFRHPCFY